ncbi:MAG TPA: hypothetical protein VGW14_03145 [Thermoleophilaceae bacterium]|nr:hypothetical protein [Thermoleophilaceae bacterium]
MTHHRVAIVGSGFSGRNSALWPTFTWPFRKRTRQFDEGAYTLATA